MAQLVARLSGGQEAVGSSPATRTSREPRHAIRVVEVLLFFSFFSRVSNPLWTSAPVESLDTQTRSWGSSFLQFFLSRFKSVMNTLTRRRNRINLRFLLFLAFLCCFLTFCCVQSSYKKVNFSRKVHTKVHYFNTKTTPFFHHKKLLSFARKYGIMIVIWNIILERGYNNGT